VTRIRPTLAATLAALAALALLALLGGCAAGFGARTIQPYAPSDGVIANTGSLRILDALVVSEPGSGRGVLSMTLVNRGTRDDELTDISSPAGRIDLTGTRTLPAGRSVTFGAGTDPSATLETLTREPGRSLSLRLTFARTQPVTLRTVVVSPIGPYTSVTPGPQTPEETTDTPTPVGTATGTATAGATAAPTDGATPSDSASPTPSN
jgi:hypothetical protein